MLYMGAALGGNLRERLQRIRLIRGAEEPYPAAVETNSGKIEKKHNSVALDTESFAALGWVSAGHLTLRREIMYGELVLPGTMPDAAGIVMPGIAAGTSYGDLLFFDLETTGLSGGAGTIAFLAAFGRLSPAGGPVRHRLCITQYLLLDYPGEYDFIEALRAEFKPGGTGLQPAVTVVSYNGKSFDSQVLKTRCLMNRISPPEYNHADLLHPARRLWKSLLPDCSQGTIEAEVFGIDRTGDIPGAMAPDIWFAFLKTGDIQPLMGICEHNLRDVSGLARIFSAMACIAANPESAINNIKFDMEALAIRWYTYTRRKKRHYKAFGTGQDGGAVTNLWETAQKLLQIAAETGYPRAGFLYALSLLRSGNYLEGRDRLLKAASEPQPVSVQAAALRALAIDSERREKNAVQALALAERGLELPLPESPLRDDFQRRVRRLRGNGE
jgi:uncharacterized protein YprB with RNaseH-like and TPR domain